MTLTILSSLFALTGCPAGKTCDTGDSAGTCDSGSGGGGGGGDTDTDTDTDTDADLTFNVAWDATGATLSITNGSGSYLFGIAQESDGGWLGEDGIAGVTHAYGNQSADFDINHDAMSDSSHLTTVNKLGDITKNSSTLFSDTIAEAGHLAYMLTDGTTCWTFNDVDSYYPEYGNPDCS